MSKQTAIDLVNQFAANAAAISQWPQVNKQAFANGLIERINDPNRIDQAGTPLCGPSTLLRSLDMANPDAYARAGIDLYTTGTCRINNLTITPGRELKAAAVPSNTNPADWVLLCSIRDSSNWFLSPAGWFGNNLAGVTIPSTIEGWFRSAGYTHIINDTSLTGGDIPVVKSMCAQRASQRFGEGYNVAMLIDADMLEPDTQGDWVSMYPDHWVILNSAIQNAGTVDYSVNVSFSVYTWGSIRPVPFDSTKPLRYEYFLNKFYGFVAAKL